MLATTRRRRFAYYIEYRAAQLAQEAREELRKKRRAGTPAAKERAISKLRPLRCRALSAVLGLLALTSGLLTIFFALGVGAALGQTPDRPFAPLLSFLIAAACGLVTAVCGVLADRFIKKTRMPE
jgi:amino acid transporter